MGVNLITALEIYTHYPQYIEIASREHPETGTFTSLMYMKRGDFIHKIMLSFDPTPEWPGFSTAELAIAAMHGVATSAIAAIEKMGNPPAKAYETFSWCGCCEHYHRESFHGDCRQDDERFTREEIVEKFPGARIYDQEEIVEVKGT
jgi:hypothetical protein